MVHPDGRGYGSGTFGKVTRKVFVNGRELNVALDDDGGFRAGGRTGAASIVQVEQGVYSVLLDGRSYEVRAHGATLEVAGQRFSVEVEDPRAVPLAHAHSLEGKQTVRAAIPGKVVRLLVSEGAEVRHGQSILVVEAMKMQNEVQSPKDGRVVAISVAEGTAVAAGQTLAVVE